MKCATGLCILWLLLIGNAYAAQTEEYALNDPLARRIVCTGSHEAKGFGPGYARVSIFSVPEPSGAGERLYVGFVEDL